MSALTPDIDLYCVYDALIGGRGAHVKIDDNFVYANGAYPNYVKWFMQQNSHPEIDLCASNTIDIEKAFLICNYNFIWGHWLTEMYPKLFTIKQLNQKGLFAPILLAKATPSWICRIIQSTLPGQEILFFDHTNESCRVACALLPNMLQRDYVFHHSFRYEIESLTSASTSDLRLLFVSRSPVPSPTEYRFLENSREIEDIAVDMGLTVVRPETLSWEEQLDVFSNSSLLVGEFGSGLHNAIASPRGTRVVSLNWVGNDVQSRIANFRGHNLGYILPDDGIPRVHGIGEDLQNYRIDPDEFRTKIGSLLP